MYKVFFNERLIALHSIEDKAVLSDSLEIKDLEDLKNKLPLILDAEDDITLVSDNVDVLLEQFKQALCFVEAAGGIVCNENDELLFIHRLGVWDLPKGKLEKGESPEVCAGREIAEECGISGHQIKEKITDTYHIYERKGKLYLKKTYWYYFELDNADSQELTPQTEEDIEQVVWFDQDEITLALVDTYASIQEVYQSFLALDI